jgi:YHS domain-containing protein
MKFRMLLAAFAAVALLASYTLSVADEKAPGPEVKCPVSGKAVNPKATVDFNGGKVYFCCEGCPKAFTDNTAKYATKANFQLVQTGQLTQIKCPLTGKDCDAAKTVEVGGVKVAFCCNSCKGKVAKATGDDQMELVFSADAAKKGFKAAK